MRVYFQLDSGALQRKLAAIKRGFVSFEEPLRQASEYQLKQIDRNFAGEGSVISSRWQPLKASTILQRMALGFGAGPILQRTGALRKSFYESKLNNNELEITSSNPHFPTHQAGKGNIPARPMIGHSDQMKQEVVNIFMKYLSNIVING